MKVGISLQMLAQRISYFHPIDAHRDQLPRRKQRNAALQVIAEVVKRLQIALDLSHRLFADQPVPAKLIAFGQILPTNAHTPSASLLMRTLYFAYCRVLCRSATSMLTESSKQLEMSA
jgi:hypothetical protein